MATDEDEQDDVLDPVEDDDVEVFDGDVLAPQLEKYSYTKRGKKAPYRALTVPERDMLFAFYEKWNGNMLAMTRDPECRFKADSQIRYYAKFYHFSERYTALQRKKAETTIAGLRDSKLLAIERATEMLRPKQMPFMDAKTRVPILDLEGKPMFYTLYPDHKTVKTAWEIIKTELGEPTTISKSEINNPEDEKIRAALDELKKLTEHAITPDNGDAVQGERGAARDTTEVSPAVQHDPNAQPSAQ